MGDNNNNFIGFSEEDYINDAAEKQQIQQEIKQNKVLEDISKTNGFNANDYVEAAKDREEFQKEYKKKKRKERANRRKANGFNIFVKSLLIIVIGIVIFYLLNSVDVTTDLNRKVTNNVVDYQLDLNNIMSFAWVRVRFDIPELSDEYLDEHIQLSDNWKRYGDWYYYLGRVDPRTTIPVIDSTNINLEEVEAEELNLEVEAEAISYLLNKPNFADDNPWNDTKIHIMLK